MSDPFAVRLLRTGARSAVLEIADGGDYETKAPYAIRVGTAPARETGKSVNILTGLVPDTDVRVCVKRADAAGEEIVLVFHTEAESVSLNVRDFGAKGDGKSDDTLFLQAAINTCPPDGRVVIPRGTYRFRCLFLKSDLTVYLGEGAVLKAIAEPESLPVLPGECLRTDKKEGFPIGSWEGNPLPMYTGLISGFGVKRVRLLGEGTIDGSACYADWWRDERIRALPARPRLLFLSHAEDVVVEGLTFQNSPSWTIHPHFSENLAFYGTCIKNPAVSPNTDGLNPESCRHVQIVGMHFSLGDDCIAIKSGKIYMARHFYRPSSDIAVRRCLLENGHGAVTVGSEIAAGVYDVLVEDCVFRHTDRGLRIKTRRGRGEASVLSGITFRRIRMEEVLTPLVINSFYFCDPDGRTSYVGSREALPVDERTPSIGELSFEDIHCTNAHFRAAHIEGLPERKIEKLTFRRVHISMAEDAREGAAAMAEGVEPTRAGGMYISNVRQLVLEDVRIDGVRGEAFALNAVEEITH